MSLYYTANNIWRQETARVCCRVCQSVQGTRVTWRQRDMIHLISGIHRTLKRAQSSKHQHHRHAVTSSPDSTQKTETGPQ